MMLKSRLATFVSALVLAGSAFAGQQYVCPSIDMIKAEGISMAEEIGEHIYLTYQISDYNTDTLWGFIIAPLEGDSNDSAIEEANDILGSMNGPGIPQQQTGALICEYETGIQGVFAAAIKNDQMITPVKLKQFFQNMHK